MVPKAFALLVVAVGLAAPAFADTKDDAFLANLNTSGMSFGPPDKAIAVAKTIVCGSLHDNPGNTNAELIAKVIDATSWPSLNAAYFTGAAIQAYCPQYGGALTPPSVPSKVPTSPPSTAPAGPTTPSVQSA